MEVYIAVTLWKYCFCTFPQLVARQKVVINKNTLGVKSPRPIRSSIANRQVPPNALILAEANIYNKKGGQVTKPIILVKICYKLLYVIQGVKNIFDKVTFWPQLISKLLVAPACLQCCF